MENIIERIDYLNLRDKISRKKLIAFYSVALMALCCLVTCMGILLNP